SPASPPHDTATLPRDTSTRVASPRGSTRNSVPTTRTVTDPDWTSNVRPGRGATEYRAGPRTASTRTRAGPCSTTRTAAVAGSKPISDPSARRIADRGAGAGAGSAADDVAVAPAFQR